MREELMWSASVMNFAPSAPMIFKFASEVAPTKEKKQFLRCTQNRREYSGYVPVCFYWVYHEISCSKISKIQETLLFKWCLSDDLFKRKIIGWVINELSSLIQFFCEWIIVFLSIEKLNFEEIVTLINKCILLNFQQIKIHIWSEISFTNRGFRP